MKKISFFSILILSLFLTTTTLSAKGYKMVFWYPGEAGSTAEAEPIITEFFDYINGRLKMNFSGKYFNSVPKGLVYIKKDRPQFGITSWVALKENESTLPHFGVMAKTLPLPKGIDTDQFTIVGYRSAEGGEWSPSDKLVIYSSIPMSLAFLRSRLAPDLKGSTSIQNTNTILMILKKIASSNDPNVAALLTPTEKHTLDNLNSEWTKNLTALYKCKPIPTAPLIYFGERPEISDDFLKVLAAMPNDPLGKEILETLRLKGFK